MENREMVMEEMEAANGGHMLLDLFSIMQKIVVGEMKPTMDRDFFKTVSTQLLVKSGVPVLNKSGVPVKDQMETAVLSFSKAR